MLVGATSLSCWLCLVEVRAWNGACCAALASGVRALHANEDATVTDTRIVNIAEVQFKENGNGERFQARIGRVGPLLGSTGLGCTLTVIPPGKRAFPFHRHHVIHELFFILSGSGEYRLDGRRLPVRAGDIIAAPAGKEAHQIVNTSAEELRFLAFSTIGEVDVVDYPDSGKVGIGAGIKNADFTTATFKALGRITPADYWEGEEEGR
jgi:uncharacterized cupin superfamily protein